MRERGRERKRKRGRDRGRKRGTDRQRRKRRFVVFNANKLHLE